jgi:putative chitinase
MIAVDGGVLRDIEPATPPAKAARQKAIVEGIGGILRPTLEQFAIDSRLRAAHFLAQICHESDGFCTTVEYASGDAYEGRERLGNTKPGDGRRFKGRGLIQLTGRANYTQYGKLLSLELVDEPALAAEPKAAASFGSRTI